MKTLIIALLLVTLTGFASAGVVTLTAQSRDGTNGVAELSIGPYELAEVISFPRSVNGGYQSRLEIRKDGVSFWHFVEPLRTDAPAVDFDPVVVAGPATLRLVAGSIGMCTVRVSPEAFPPDRSILLAPGTNQARITLECSTNLVQWFPATNGVYGPLPEAKFFRIKLEPLQ